MFYPEDFKNRVKKAYPNYDELHRRLDEGDVFVGRYLDDSSSTRISFETILSATSLEKLKNEARVGQEKVAIYNEWCRLRREQN
ncbi:hypothetical protein EGR52_02140 [bacterium]|nr:hypothetical protein [bacterium]